MGRVFFLEEPRNFFLKKSFLHFHRFVVTYPYLKLEPEVFPQKREKRRKFKLVPSSEKPFTLEFKFSQGELLSCQNSWFNSSMCIDVDKSFPKPSSLHIFDTSLKNTDWMFRIVEYNISTLKMRWRSIFEGLYLVFAIASEAMQRSCPQENTKMFRESTTNWLKSLSESSPIIRH